METPYFSEFLFLCKNTATFVPEMKPFRMSLLDPQRTGSMQCALRCVPGGYSHLRDEFLSKC